MRRRILGFTLIELMIVIAIIAIIAAIAIPGLLRARIASNEGAASASLKSLVSAQASFWKSASVNQAMAGELPNSTGEYGVFNELSGGSLLRGTADSATKPALKVTDMSAAFNIPDGQAIANKSGYNYQIFLPNTGGALTDAVAGNAAIAIAADNESINAQENRWICYSWPSAWKSSGVRAFVVSESGEVYVSQNTDATGTAGFWFGTTNVPLFNSAMFQDTTAGITPDDLNFTNIAARDTTNIIDNNHLWQPAS
jgi:prepilin-type N-terminal cleavage/methylation domain-containing protein